MAILTNYKKKKEYLICIDSDGCAMDTMDIKHIQCFGPCMISEWNLEPWREQALRKWNEVNLYSMTRGMNRFKTLAMVLQWVDDTCCRIEDINSLADWVNYADELSNASLKRELERTGCLIFQKAFDWSVAVNQSITLLPDEFKKPFGGVKEAIEAAHQIADIAIVSSANREAVVEEWEKYGLMQFVDVVLTQDMGSKAYCIREMKNYGYEADHILMVGDAPGDREAAERNQVYYYPILVR